MKKLRVKLVLTDAEARSLDYIIDNTADYPDVLAELFSGASEMKIAERALEKWRASVAVAYRRGGMDELTTDLTSGGDTMTNSLIEALRRKKRRDTAIAVASRFTFVAVAYLILNFLLGVVQ
jgi:hypothetical protein